MRLDVKNAEFSYNGNGCVFKGVEFSMQRGEILSILGPNGSGKTTLLKCLNGLFPIKNGVISIDGQALHSMKRSDIGKKIGYVPQTPDVTFPYTVLEMVLMGRASHVGMFSSPTAKDVAIAKEAVETLGLLHLMDRPFPRISGGEAQLVLIARALAAEPTTLLLDEPTSHLDFRNQAVILDVLEILAKEKNIAIIMTTHFPDHALLISDKALLMANGKGSIVGNAGHVLNETNLRDAFGIDVRIISLEENGEHMSSHVVPLRKKSFKRCRGNVLEG